MRQLNRILHSKKVLIVLDDLDQSSYSNFVVRLCNLVSVGSRIIITTRDVHLLNQLKIDMPKVDVYEVKKLEQVDSLELFNYHAFGKSTPTASLKQLSVSFVTHAGGLPLALKVLGSLLRGRTQVSFWKAKLEEVQKIPVNDIQRILQVSYDNLSEMEKAIFLDIAFFFVGKYNFEADEIFQSCGFCPKVGIQILVERCLLKIDKNDRLQMHNLIIDMGRDLGKSTRLSWQGNAWNDLQNQEGTDQIEGLVLDLTQSTKKHISSRIFEKLPKLRLLEIINAHGIRGHINNSFDELRSIRWSSCTWTQLPSGFQPQKLVSLHMPYSNFKILWNGAMPLKSLKMINLNYSVNLTRTPDFGNSKFIERLFFRGCEGLLKLHPSIRDLTDLHVLDLGGCSHLKDLAEPSGQFAILGHLYSGVKRSSQPMKQWPNLEYLDLGECSQLRQLPEQLGEMEMLKILDLSYTEIDELPDSIVLLKRLETLQLFHCTKLRKLPEQIGNMQFLRTFRAGNNAIEQLPDSFVGLINLESLDLSFCQNLRKLPHSIWQLKSLKVLNLEFCSKLKWLPEELGEMQCLEYLNASHTSIEQVSDSIGQLSRLQRLDLSWCDKLEYLPNIIWNLTSLTNLDLLQADTGRIDLPDTVKNTKLVALGLNCDIRLWLHIILSFSSLKQLCLCDESEGLSSTKPFSKLNSLQYLELYKCTSIVSSFLELPFSLTHLSLCYHATLVHLPDFSSLKQLEKLDIIGYISIKSLPPLPPHLRSLTVYDCTSLQDQSDMSMFKEMVDLSFGKSNPESISLKQSFHQVIRKSLPLFKVDVPRTVPRIAKWLCYKSRGRTLSFDIPPLSEDKFLGLALWILFTSKYRSRFNIEAVVTNKTNGTKEYYQIPVYCVSGTAAYSLVRCIRGDEISITSGDSIEISFERQLYDFAGEEVPFEVNVEMCAAHVIQKSPFTPDFPSVFNLIDGV